MKLLSAHALLCLALFCAGLFASHGLYGAALITSRQVYNDDTSMLRQRDVLLPRTPNFQPAPDAYSGCSGKLPSGSGCQTHSDSGIQIGECHSNERVNGQKFAYFVPVSPSDKSFNYEGGPYGTCYASTCAPSSADVSATDNSAAWCFNWAGGVGAGKKATPPPIVCPSNLQNCYAKDYYKPGGRLASHANDRPTSDVPFTGVKTGGKTTCSGASCSSATYSQIANGGKPPG